MGKKRGPFSSKLVLIRLYIQISFSIWNLLHPSILLKTFFFTWCTFPSTPIGSPLILPKIILQPMYFESDNLFHTIYFIFLLLFKLASISTRSTMTQSTSTSKIWPKLTPRARTWIGIWSKKIIYAWFFSINLMATWLGQVTNTMLKSSSKIKSWFLLVFEMLEIF